VIRSLLPSAGAITTTGIPSREPDPGRGNYIVDAAASCPESSSRVVSLLELMKKFNVGSLYETGNLLGIGEGTIEARFKNNSTGAIQEPLLSLVREWLRLVTDSCQKSGLTYAQILVTNFTNEMEAMPTSSTYGALKSLFEKLAERVKDELSQHAFYQIQPDKVKYYDDAPALFGPEVAAAFPSAMDDIEEAGKCLAVGRSTACVFHLMRSFSPAIKAIATEFAFKPNENWGPFLNDFRNEIWKKYPDDKTKVNEEQRVFYSDLEQQLRAIKDAWRNPTMHSIAAVYTEDKAEEIFGYVRGLMKKAAEKLKEQP
jgi:hypothetical protein